MRLHALDESYAAAMALILARGRRIVASSNDARVVRACEHLINAPSTFVGEIDTSADLLIPSSVLAISNIVAQRFPEIDDALIKSLVAASEKHNLTPMRVAVPEELCEFLEEQKGRRAFTVSW